MTILLDTDSRTILSMSSGGFVDKALNTVEYNGEIPEINEEAGERIEWDGTKVVVIKAV